MFSRKIQVDWIAVWSSSLAFLVYVNSFKAGFVYDDNRAILSNGDVLPGSPWTGLWTNDFWGTPLWHSGSHKSFRPLATLSFRLNCYFSGFNPAPFHVTNVILHTLTTWLFVRVARTVFRSSSFLGTTSSGSSCSSSNISSSCINRSTCSRSTNTRNGQVAVLVSSLLFACHPIHCEAVSGVVGRADVGATGFALSAFLVYVRHVKHRDKQKQHRNVNSDPAQNSRCPICFVYRKLNRGHDHQNSAYHQRFCFRSIAYLVISILLAAAAMFTKEQGITILLVCAMYDLLRSIIRARHFQSDQRIRKLECCWSVIVLGICFLALFHLRLRLMGGFEPPTFAKADNPTAHHPNFCTRLATFLFLPVFNLFLLVFPHRLSYDWSMESIPRVEHFSDPRNFITVLFYFFLLRRLISSFRRVNKSVDSGGSQVGINQSPVKIGVCSVCSYSSTQQKCCSDNNNSITCHPQPPTFDEIGGVKKGISRIHHQSQFQFQKQSRVVAGGGHCNCSASSNKLLKTLRKQTPSLVGEGHCLISRSRFLNLSLSVEHGALLLELAFLIFPFLPATNLFFYVGFVIAERVLYFPSVGFSLLVGHGFLRLWTRYERQSQVRHFLATGLCVTLLFLAGRSVRRNEDWRDEEKLYSSGIRVNPPKSWGNLGNVLSRQGRTSEAKVAYRQALRFRFNMADVHYNLGLLLERQGRLDEALTSYRSAIHFRPLLAPAYLNAGQVLTRQRKIGEAIELLRRCFKLSDEGVKDLGIHIEAKVAAQLCYGKLLFEEYHDPKGAIAIYRQAVKLMPPNFSQAQAMFTEAQHLLRAHGRQIRREAPDFFNFGELLLKHSAKCTRAFTLFFHSEVQGNVSGYALPDPEGTCIYIAMGEALSRVDESFEAETWFKEALNTKPDHIPAHLTYGKMLARNETRLLEAESWFLRAKRIAPADAAVYQHYGQFLASQGRHAEAAELFVTAYALSPNEYEIVLGAANGWRQAGNNQNAEIHYKKAVALRPQEARAHMNLGAIFHLNRKYLEAQRSYLTALRLKPHDFMTLENLKKLCQLQAAKKLSLASCTRRVKGES